MAVINGAKGTLKQGASLETATEIPVIDISITQTASTIDTTDSSNTSGYRDKISAKFTDWNGSANAFLKDGDTELVVGEQYHLFIMASDETSNEVYWEGDVFITKIGFDIPIVGDDVVKRSIEFEGSGALTKVDNTGA